MGFGLVWFGLVSPFEAARVRVTSNVVEKAEGVENVIPLTRPGNISAAYPGNTALWHDEASIQIVPSTSIGEEGTSQPPAGSTLMPS
jgi:hypothetical protein